VLGGRKRTGNVILLTEDLKARGEGGVHEVAPN
jgi:hypothetical protein